VTEIRTARFQGAIFNVGGVLVDSPHHWAWREALTELMEGAWSDIRGQGSYAPELFTHTLYEQVAADMPRLAAARATLEYFGVPGADRRAARYAAVMQEHTIKLVEMGEFAAFADALRFILAVKDLRIPVAAASLSKDTELFLRQVRLDSFAAVQRLDYPFIRPGLTLFQLFDADASGRNLRSGKHGPAVFLTAAEELGVVPGSCFVVEDAVAGVAAAKAEEMTVLGVARLGDVQLLREAGADLVVTTLDDVSVDALAKGRLEQRRASAGRRGERERSRGVWSLTYEGFDPERQGLREALCALGNGYFVTRGALPEARADGVNYPGTYVAGLYNRLQTPIAGRTVENEDLVNVPNWLPLSFRVAGGPWFDIREADVLDHRLELDLRRAMLTRHLRWKDPGGRRTSLVQRRLVSMKDPHLAGLQTTFTAENWSGTLEVWSGLDGRIVNCGFDAARAAARAAGYRGAMFPWQGGSDGREETQRLHLNPRSGRWLPDYSSLQRHVNIAVAYNVWLHYMVTGSIRFLRFTGAEMLIEIARFWASAATYNSQLDRYEILGVMGPDEYHDAYPGRDRPGLDNNTYTNVMAVWVLRHALQALEELPPYYRDEVIGQLALGADELNHWRDITSKMRVVFHEDGVLSQFEGYEQLEEFDWEGYRARYGNIQRLDRLLEAEGDSANRYKVSKQADVLMLLFLLSPGGLQRLLRRLGYEVTSAQLRQTIAYYLDRTAHGSTLSGVVSAWVLARTDAEQAWRFLLNVLQGDVADVQGGTTAEGIHLGAMAGTLAIVMLGLTGIQAHGDTLRFDPALLPPIRQLRFSIHYRGHRVEIILTQDRLSVSSRPGAAAPIKIFVLDETRELAPGTRADFPLEPPRQASEAG
jgi:trehalose/maltose hydrolase-like predicted phosphorylase/beta-phosphoglucomutase-like phosphatase (HAD superfamily)